MTHRRLGDRKDIQSVGFGDVDLTGALHVVQQLSNHCCCGWFVFVDFLLTLGQLDIGSMKLHYSDRKGARWITGLKRSLRSSV